MADLELYDDAIEGEIVDETCDCGQPGTLTVDPYSEELYDEILMLVLCPKCLQDRLDDI